jgi:hypothetical protein
MPSRLELMTRDRGHPSADPVDIPMFAAEFFNPGEAPTIESVPAIPAIHSSFFADILNTQTKGANPVTSSTDSVTVFCEAEFLIRESARGLHHLGIRNEGET